MSYYIDLFSPETATAFEKSSRDVSGFRISRKTYVENQKIGPGDKLICYVTRLQRFVGVLEIKSKPFQDDRPIFTKENDPFILRFNVAPIVWLPLEKSIPIHHDFIWNVLSFTKELSKGSNRWTFMVFSSPRLWPKDDCIFLLLSALMRRWSCLYFALHGCPSALNSWSSFNEMTIDQSVPSLIFSWWEHT